MAELRKVRITAMEAMAEVIVQTVEQGGQAKFTVTGNSMYPIFRSDMDSVFVARPGRLRLFDVILYRRADGAYVLHRIVGRARGAFVLCGDGQTELEYGVTPGMVLAVVTAFERGGRRVSVRAPWYRLYAALWCLVRPLRFPILAALRRVKRRFVKGRCV